MAITSTSLSKRKIGATGPKISSENTRISRVTLVKIVGSTKLPPSALHPPPRATWAPLATASSIRPQTPSAARPSINGPTLTSGSLPSPTFNAATAAVNLATNSSKTPECTNNLLEHTQVCPALRYLETNAPCTAASRSASSKTINGALPPSSIEVRLTVFAHSAISCLPTGVEPVKVTLRTSGLEVISAPMAAVWPVTILINPGGKPARSASSTIARADSGVLFAGLQTTEQPAAIAGAILRVSIALGKFQGVIQATTPTGCLITTRRLSLDGWAMVSPYTRFDSSLNHST